MGYLNHATYLDPELHLLTCTFLLTVHLPRTDANIPPSSFLFPISYFLITFSTTDTNLLTRVFRIVQYGRPRHGAVVRVPHDGFQRSHGASKEKKVTGKSIQTPFIYLQLLSSAARIPTYLSKYVPMPSTVASTGLYRSLTCGL